MSRSLKIILFAAIGFVGLLVLVSVALLLFVDANAYKPRLEAAASSALGMEVSAGGSLGVGFFPGLHVTLRDLHIRNRGTDVASATGVRFEIDLLPLLRKEVRIGKISLEHPQIFIERDRDGRFNFEKSAAAGGTFPALDLTNASFTNGTFLYADRQSGSGFEAGGCNLDAHGLRLSGGKSADPMQNLSFTAEFACGEIRKDDFTVSDLKLSANGKSGLFDLDPVRMRVFGAPGTASIQADFSGAVPLYDVRYLLPQFQIEEFFKTLSPKKVAEGSMDFSANLSMRGKTVNAILQTLDGQISLRGEKLMFNSYDIDETLSRFDSSQNFNLVDMGAFFFAGPLGLVLTKGYDFASLFQGSGGGSEIRTLVSDWKVERGVAQAQDVAMATKENRIALQGRLDFVNEQFDDVTVAMIDAQGCAKVSQKISGAFQKPVVEQPSLLESLTGPALTLLKKGRDLFSSEECEVFYTGSVAPPK